jgi:ferredoxin-NADP reductase
MSTSPEPGLTSARPPSEAFDARVVSTRQLTPSVRQLVLERIDGREMRFVPGQWVNLLVPVHGAEVKRAYSIASAPVASPRFDLAVTRVEGGAASIALHEAAEGAVLRAVGPSGLFTRDATDPAAAVLVGTGTGVTPLRSMVRAAIDAASSAEIVLLWGFRHEEDILYRDELVELAASHPNVSVHVTLSKPPESWGGLRGYVQQHLGRLVAELGDPEAHVYACGLERMVKAVRDLARGELAIPRKQVHQERYD